MSDERRNRWVCGAALAAASLGALAGAVRWLGPDAWVAALAFLGRAPLLGGALMPIVAYLLAQSVPGGRAPLRLGPRLGDGWNLVLAVALLCAILASFPAVRGRPLDVLATVPITLGASFLLADRARRLQRASPTAG